MKNKQGHIDKKVTLVTFAPIKRTQGGASATALSLAESLYAAGMLGNVICLGYDTANCGIPKSKFSSPPFPMFNRVLGPGLSLARKLIPVWDRRIREEFFDSFVSKDSTFRSARTVLFAKPVFPKSAAIAKKLGIKTLGLATICHPRFNYQQVQREQRRFGIRTRTSYTDAKRVKNIEHYFDTIDHILSISKASKRTLLANGVPREKIIPVFDTTGVDCERFQPKPEYKKTGTFRVLHISYMNLIKGLSYLFQAWKNLNLTNAELLLGGPMDAAVQYILRRTDPPGVRLLGYVPSVSGCLQNVDVSVSPSLSDSGPITVLESMASGTPVIVSNACGLSALVTHGKEGFVYKFDQVEQLEKHIMWCYINREKLEAMGKAARSKALQYTQKDFAREVVNVIARLT